MHDGPRYPGSLVVYHVKQQALEVVAKYRRQRKRATELPRVVSLLLAWEGAIVAGAFLSAIAYVGLHAYMMERFDERTRRTSHIRAYQQHCAQVEEAVRSLQASLEFYRRLSEAADRQLSRTLTGANRSTAERRRLERELVDWLGAGRGGGGGSWFGRLTLGLGPVAVAPWRELYVRWRLAGWRREMEVHDRDAAHLAHALRHDEALAALARDKVQSLESCLLRHVSHYEALHWQLDYWRAYRCRAHVVSLSGQLWAGGQQAGQPEGGQSAEQLGLQGPARRQDPSGEQGRAQGHVGTPDEERPVQGEQQRRQTSLSGSDTGSEQAAGSGTAASSGIAAAAEGVQGEGRGSASTSSGGGDADAGGGSSRGRVTWLWSVEVTTPAWMREEQELQPPPPPPRLDDDLADNAAAAGPEYGSGLISDLSDLVEQLRPLVADSMRRW